MRGHEMNLGSTNNCLLKSAAVGLSRNLSQTSTEALILGPGLYAETEGRPRH